MEDPYLPDLEPHQEDRLRNDYSRINWAIVISVISLVISVLTTYRDKFYYKDSLTISIKPYAATATLTPEYLNISFEAIVVNSGTRDAEIEDMFLNITSKSSPTNIYHDVTDTPDLMLLKPGEIRRVERHIRSATFDGLANIQLFVNSIDGSGQTHFGVIHVGRAEVGYNLLPNMPARAMSVKWRRQQLDLFKDVRDEPEIQPTDTGPLPQ